MNRKNEWKILCSFLREKSYLFAGYVMIVFIFLAIAALYGEKNSFSHISYAAVIILFIFLVAGLFDYYKYRDKSKRLWSAMTKIGEREEVLPEPNSLLESLYYEMIVCSEKERRELISSLDEKKKDLGDYYTLWTHQIKTPIAALQLLLQKENSKSEREELFKIEQYTEMALYYARLDSMESDMLLKKHDVYEILKQAVKKYAILFIGSKLSFSLEEFTCETITDKKWLSFVLEQILSNAIKYTKEGGIYIYGGDRDGNKIENVTCNANQEIATIVIEDTGIGIPESDLPRIFDRGFTGYNGRSDQKSTGLGLYLCKQIMNRLSHGIRVESVILEGTKVILALRREVIYSGK